MRCPDDGQKHLTSRLILGAYRNGLVGNTFIQLECLLWSAHLLLYSVLNPTPNCFVNASGFLLQEIRWSKSAVILTSGVLVPRLNGHKRNTHRLYPLAIDIGMEDCIVFIQDVIEQI